MGAFSTINPATGEVLRSYNHLSWSEAEKAIAAAHADFKTWSKYPLEKRSEVVKKLGEALRAHKSELADMMHLEMGKLISEAKAEIDKCILTCEYYSEFGPSMLKNQKAEPSTYPSAEVSFQPQGVIFSIMPWNFPLWQVIRFAAPAVMAGNTIVLKHADLTAGMGEFIEKIFSEITSPFKLLRNVHVDHDVAAQIIADPRVHGVTFTGSSQGGKAVAMEAAKNLKKTVLELGGSDAYLVLADADIEKAAKISAKARLVNCGQSCVAGKRFIVDSKVAAPFIKNFVSEMQAAEVAPLASAKFKKQIIEQVEQLKSWGGKVALGGTAPQGAGAFYPPTVIVFEKDHPEVHRMEVFGPVASVIIANNTEHALEIANSSPFGLGGGIFTGDAKKGKELVEKELQAGFVVVNDQVKSDPRIPFGGVKESGYGRELGPFGIMEFVNIKTVAMGN